MGLAHEGEGRAVKEDRAMRGAHRYLILAVLGGAVGLPVLLAAHGWAACGFVVAGDQKICQPAQQVFISWDPKTGLETFVVQPAFESDAVEFGLVIPTPTPPKVERVPRDFFRSLGVFATLKRHDFPRSRLLPDEPAAKNTTPTIPWLEAATGGKPVTTQPAVVVLESGFVGTLDYKVLNPARADALSNWLKENKYHYAGDEATLDYYVRKKWVFTVVKIDSTQMPKSRDGTHAGEIAPARFQFKTDRPIYPLRIVQGCAGDRTDILFYVQAPFKADLPGELTYQHQWIPLLRSASACTEGELPGRGDRWLTASKDEIPGLLKRTAALGFGFTPGRRPVPNKQGHTPTSLEWARKLTEDDLKILSGAAPYCAKLPDVDDGFTAADLKDARRARAIAKVITARLEQSRRAAPDGYLVREAPAEDVRQLRQLTGHLQAGQFLTRFRKTFTRAELSDDLEIVPARLGRAEDTSDYVEVLPISPP
jgi:hypothetical protein